MKKLALILAFILVALPAFAAWTVTVPEVKKVEWDNGQTLYRVQMLCVSDSSDPGSFNLSTYVTDKKVYEGGILFQIDTDPGTAPDAVWDVTFSSDNAGVILALTGLSVSATTINDASADLGFTPIIFDLAIDFADIGSASDSVTLYIYIIK